ncbi:hypothetical protein D3C77_429310 [compost metagenome]
MLQQNRHVHFAAGCQAQARGGEFADHPDLAAWWWAVAKRERCQALSHEYLQACIQLEQRHVCTLYAAPDPTLEGDSTALVLRIDKIVEADSALDWQVMADHPVAFVHAMASGDDIGGAG